MKKKNIFLIVGSIFILISLIFLSYNLIEDYQAGKNASDVLIKLKEEMIEIEDDEEDINYEKNPYMEMPIVEIDGNEYIGYIQIPNIGIELPVLSSFSYEKLKLSPTREEGSIYLNNMIISAHNYRRHFGKIGNLEEKDLIVFKDMDKNIFNFEVVNIEVIDAKDVDKLRAGDWDLSLYTCDLTGNKRIVVRAKRIDKK